MHGDEHAHQDPPAGEGEAETAAVARPWRARVRGVRRVVLRSLLGVLTLVLVLLVLVLYTAPFTRLALRGGLAVYNGMIPGTIEVEAIDGALGRSLELRGVSLRDSTERELVAIDRLSLGLRTGRLFGLAVDPGPVRLEGAVVLLPTGDEGGFGDFAPPSDEPPPPPDPDAGIGPDLPITLDVDLEVEGLEVRQELEVAEGEAPDSKLLVDLRHLSLVASAQGREATASLALASAVPVAGDLDVHELALELEWTSPEVRLSRLAVDSSWGEVEVEPLALNLEQLAGEVHLASLVEQRWFEDRSKLRTDGRPSANLEAKGDPSGARLELDATAPGLASASVSVGAAVEPGTSVDLGARLHAAPRRLAAGLRAEAVTADLEAHVRELEDGGYELVASVRCLDCDPGRRPVLLDVHGRGDPATRDAEATVRLEAAETTLDAEASLEAGQRVALDAWVEAPDLGRVADLASTFVPRPPLDGAGRARIQCEGVLSPRDLSCDVQAGLEGLAPLERARVDLTARLDETHVEAELRELDVGVEGLSIAQRGEPMKASYGLESGAVELANVGIVVGTGTGDARISVEGQLDPKGVSDLRLGVHELDLRALEKFAPGLGLRGTVGVSLAVLGKGSDPTIRANVRGRQLAYRGVGLGRLDASLGYGDEHAGLSATVEASPVGDVSLRLDLPMRLDLSKGSFLPGPEPWHLSLRIRGADLARLARFAPDPPPVEGKADLDLDVTGGERPRGQLDLRLVGLGFDGRALGGAHLDAKANARHLDARLDLFHPHAKDTFVELGVPIALDLSLDHPQARWRSKSSHLARVHVGRFDLPGIRDWAPDLEIEGRACLDARLWGSMHAPLIAAHASVDEVALEERALGSLGVDVGYAGERAVLAVQGRSPLARRIDLVATAPVHLSPASAGSPAGWNPDGAHHLRLELDGIELAALEPWLEGAPALDGRGDLELRVDGDAHAPEVRLGLGIREITVDDAKVGDLDVSARLDPGQAGADVALASGPGRGLSIHAEVPLDVDAAAGQFAWRPARNHQLEVHVVGVDRELVGQFVDLPEALAFGIDGDVLGHGTLADFELDATVDGDVGAYGEVQPLDLVLNVKPGAQELALRLGGGPMGTVEAGASLSIPIPRVVAGQASPTDTSIQAHLRADALALALADPFLPEELYRLDGTASASLDVSGPLGKPEIAGRLGVASAGVTVVPMRQRFTDIGIEVELEKNEVRLEKFEARAGQGQIDVSGTLTHAGPRLDGTVDLRTSKLPLEQPGVPRMAIDTKVATKLHVEPGLTQVDVDVQGALVDAKSTNVAAPKRLPNAERVIYVDQLPPGLTRGDGEPAEGEAPGEPAGKAKPAVTRIDVVLSEPIELRGPAIDMAWEGAVALVQGAGQDSATGQITNTEGTFELLSNEFVVRRGVVTIPPGADLVPYLDIEATTQIDDVEITATIRGRATRPELKLTSVPAADEATIFGMLVSGTSTPDDGPDTAKQAASLLAAFSNPALERQINEKLGVDKVGVTFGETAAQPILTVGKNLSKKVYVETRYQFGADPSDITKNKAELGLRYRFKPQWSVETFFGDAPAGGAGIFWHKAFDAEPKRYWIVPKGAEPVPAARAGDGGGRKR